MGNICLFNKKVEWPELKQYGNIIKVTWCGADGAVYFVQPFHNHTPVGWPYRVDQREFQYRIRPGNDYSFEVKQAGFERCTCHKRVTRTIHIDPSKPSGVVWSFMHGLDIRWQKSDGAVAYHVTVTHDGDVVCEFKDILECHVRVLYRFLVPRPLSRPFKVSILAKDSTGHESEPYLGERNFDGVLKVLYFVVTKAENIVGCFVVDGPESAKQLKDSFVQRGYEASPDILKSVRLRYSMKYQATLKLVESSRLSGVTSLLSPVQNICTQDLVEQGSLLLNFIIDTQERRHLLEFGIRGQNKKEQSHPFVWIDSGLDRLDGINTWGAPSPSSPLRSDSGSQWSSSSDHGYSSDSSVEINASQSEEFELQIHLFEKPGVVTAVLSKGTSKELKKVIRDLDGCRRVKIKPYKRSVLRDEPLQVTLDCSSVVIRPYAHTVSTDNLVSGVVITKMFTYEGDSSELHMHLQLKQHSRDTIVSYYFDIYHSQRRRKDKRRHRKRRNCRHVDDKSTNTQATGESSESTALKFGTINGNVNLNSSNVETVSSVQSLGSHELSKRKRGETSHSSRPQKQPRVRKVQRKQKRKKGGR